MNGLNDAQYNPELYYDSDIVHCVLVTGLVSPDSPLDGEVSLHHVRVSPLGQTPCRAQGRHH